jgi:diguanylate cyclase (GGDEF)-like protein
MKNSNPEQILAAHYEDFFIHALIREVPERLYRARILVLALLAILFFSIAVFFALIFATTLTDRRDIAFPLNVGCIVTISFLLYRMKYHGNYILCVAGNLLQLIVIFVATLIITGGPSISPAGQLLAMPSLMAFFFGGLRWGIGTMLLTITVIAMLLLLSASGFKYPLIIPATFSLQYLLLPTNFVVLCALALGYESASFALREERDKEHQKVLRLAKTDPLTGLANRRIFEETLQDRIQIYSSLNPPRAFALCYLDLDEFKPINDRYGHDVGDEVLKARAQRLRNALRGADFIGRQGGDEFMIMLDQISEVAAFEAVATRFSRIISDPIDSSIGPLCVRASLGFALFPIHGNTAPILQKAADVAMYKAKHNKLPFAVFEPDTVS